MIRFRKAEQSDMRSIALVHRKCFPDYFLTSLGVELLARYYSEFRAENDFFIVAEDEKQIVGFCMGYDRRDTNARMLFIKKNLIALSIKMLLLTLKLDRLAINKEMLFFRNLFTHKTREPGVSADGDLLSICVLEQYRGMNISKCLFTEFEKSLVSKGIKNYTLSVYKENIGAIKFYEKMGMKTVVTTEKELKLYKEI